MKKIQEMSVFKVIGDLVAVAADGIIVNCILTSIATGKKYENQFAIATDAGLSMESLIGTTIAVIGHLDASSESQRAWMVMDSYAPAPGAMHSNRAMISGMVYSADLFARTPTQRQMGNVAFIVSQKVLNSVAWRGACTELRQKKVRRGAIVTMKGRLRIREFERNEEVVRTIELTADQSADVTVYSVPSEEDEFSLGATAQPAIAPAAAVENATVPAPAKKRSRV